MHTGGGQRREFLYEDLMTTLAGADNPSAAPPLRIENGQERVQEQGPEDNVEPNDDKNKENQLPPPPFLMNNPLGRSVQGQRRRANAPRAATAGRSAISRERMYAAVVNHLSSFSTSSGAAHEIKEREIAVQQQQADLQLMQFLDSKSDEDIHRIQHRMLIYKRMQQQEQPEKVENNSIEEQNDSENENE